MASSRTSALPQPLQHQDGEDLMSAAPSLWLPRAVVKRHRTLATIIWTIMLIVFFAYVAYVVWDAIRSRKDPPASIKLKSEYFKFPDVAICVWEGHGCLVDGDTCFDPEYSSFNMTYQDGFMDQTIVLDQASREFENEYTNCKALPLSKLEVNETGVDNEDILYFSVDLLALWEENPNNETTTTTTLTRFVSVFFIHLDDGLDAFEENIIDAAIPYTTVVLENGEEFSLVRSKMLLTMTEFRGLSSTGKKLPPEQTYLQRTTSGDSIWYWTGSTDDAEYAFLWMEMIIPKFEYTIIEEVDPVDAWTIVGAIGGLWQIVCVAFGLFFVFSVKQPPDRKMRNFKKSVQKPVVVIGRRISIASSRTSQSAHQDREVDASDEDLPAGWIKRERGDGSHYYVQTMTGIVQDRSPNDPDGTPSAARGSGGGITPAHQPDTLPSYSATQAYSLPPGWIAQQDEQGRTYYSNSVLRTTQWERPTQHASTGHLSSSSTSSNRPVAIEGPLQRSRRSSGSSSASSTTSVQQQLPPSRPPALPARAPPTTSGSAHNSNSGDFANRNNGLWPRRRGSTNEASSGSGGSRPVIHPTAAGSACASSASSAGDGGGSRSLPPHWEQRTTNEGKIIYVNHATKKTQWEFPTS